MASLKKILGSNIQVLDDDPVESGVPGATWSSGGNLPAALRENAGAGATYNAALSFGGNTGSAAVAETDSYNGTSWTEVAEMNTARRLLAGAGTQTAALAYGGWPPNKAETEEWNGSSWTEVADLNTARRQASGCGVNAEACLMIGGNAEPGLANVESWNGSSWTEIADLNTAREGSNNWGTTTSAVSAGGISAPGATIAITESWDGSSWTEVSDLNVGRRRAGTSGPDNTSGLFFGGDSPTPAHVASTEHWDGSAWTEVADLAEARSMEASAGHDAGSSLAIGGTTSTADVASTEHFIAPSAINQRTEGQLYIKGSALKGFERAAGIPAGTWASGGTLNAGHGYGTGFGGAQTAAVCCFGGYPTHTNNTETYNGTSWTEVNEGNTARRNLGSFGVLTSGLAFGGGPPFGSATTESWDGTSWTSTADLPTTVYNNRGLGTSSSSGLDFGGVDAATPGKSKKANEWNGSSWTAITDMGTIRESGSSANAGTVTAGLVFGGESPSQTVNTELWNGSSWTELNNLNTARSDAGGNGISTQALCFGGSTPASPPYQQGICEFWNGTSWTEVNDLGTGLANGLAPAGGAVAGLASAGLSAPSTQNTVSQEFTADISNTTITTS